MIDLSIRLEGAIRMAVRSRQKPRGYAGFLYTRKKTGTTKKGGC